jgi:hypothetical protein
MSNQTRSHSLRLRKTLFRRQQRQARRRDLRERIAEAREEARLAVEELVSFYEALDDVLDYGSNIDYDRDLSWIGDDLDWVESDAFSYEEPHPDPEWECEWWYGDDHY